MVTVVHSSIFKQKLTFKRNISTCSSYIACTHAHHLGGSEPHTVINEITHNLFHEIISKSFDSDRFAGPISPAISS